MKKIYIVRLTEKERETCIAVTQELTAVSRKARRASILLAADANRLDKDIANLCRCSIQAVQNVRKKFVTEGFDIALNGKKRDKPPRPQLLNIEQEVAINGMQLEEPPPGRKVWTLRLLAEKAVERGIVPAVSRTTIQKTIQRRIDYGNKKRAIPVIPPKQDGECADGSLTNR